MSQSIHVEQLTKRFENVEAVAGISFTVRQGELFGFLGPNGAGKTTTINMLTGLARPDSGTIQIGGIDCTKDPKAAQHLIGVVPDESNLYPELTGFENLSFCAALYGIRKKERETRADELLKTFDLADAADRKFNGYSKGMKRKLTIAAGIIHNPDILFGVVNAFVPILMALFLTDLSRVVWSAAVPAIVLIAVSSTFLGLFVAVSVSEVFEAQTFSNFFRFPMIFLCGLFFPIEQVPVFLKPLSYLFPLTYGVDILHGAFHGHHLMAFWTDFTALFLFCVALFLVSLYNIGKRWIL